MDLHKLPDDVETYAQSTSLERAKLILNRCEKLRETMPSRQVYAWIESKYGCPEPTARHYRTILKAGMRDPECWAKLDTGEWALEQLMSESNARRRKKPQDDKSQVNTSTCAAATPVEIDPRDELVEPPPPEKDHLPPHLQNARSDLNKKIREAIYQCIGDQDGFGVERYALLDETGLLLQLVRFDVDSFFERVRKIPPRIDRVIAMSQRELHDSFAALGMEYSSPADPAFPLQKLKAKFFEKVRRHHPDRGGSSEEFIKYDLAYKLILRHLEASNYNKRQNGQRNHQHP